MNETEYTQESFEFAQMHKLALEEAREAQELRMQRKSQGITNRIAGLIIQKVIVGDSEIEIHGEDGRKVLFTLNIEPTIEAYFE